MRSPDEPRSDPVELAGQVVAPAPRMLAAIRSLVAPATLEPVALPGFRHVSEREPGPWIDCAPCSGAMVAHYVSGSPATLAQAHAIRRAAGLPHEGGMKPSELRAGVRGALGLTLSLVASDRVAIERRLVDGWALAVPLTYGKLPTHLRRWSPLFAGGHTGALAGVKGARWGWFDPLAPAGWDGEYIEPTAIMPAIWSAGVMGAPHPRPEGSDMRFRVTRNVAGKVRVNGSGHQYVALDGRRIAAPDGQIREAIAVVELIPKLDDAPGDRATAYLVGRCVWPVVEPVNVESLLLLASAAVAEVVDCEVSPR